MLELTKGDHKIRLYASAEELPIKRYSKFQKYALIESGIGADIAAIGKHFGKLFEFLTFKMQEESLSEAKNLYYTFFSMLEELNVPGLAFACLVHSIDGEPLTDLTEENLLRVVETLSGFGISQKDVAEGNERLKKKSMTN